MFGFLDQRTRQRKLKSLRSKLRSGRSVLTSWICNERKFLVAFFALPHLPNAMVYVSLEKFFLFSLSLPSGKRHCNIKVWWINYQASMNLSGRFMKLTFLIRKQFSCALRCRREAVLNKEWEAKLKFNHRVSPFLLSNDFHVETKTFLRKVIKLCRRPTEWQSNKLSKEIKFACVKLWSPKDLQLS